MRALLLTCLFAALPQAMAKDALAQDKKSAKPTKKPPHRVEFERLDTDRNGKLDAGEFLGGSVGKAAGQKQRQHTEFDRDQDGQLNVEEFWRYSNRPPTDDWLRSDFQQRDKNKDGKLTLKEHLGDKTGNLRTEARTKFFHFDTDESQDLSLTEFLDRDPDRKISVHNQFLVHDLNDDGRLTKPEFMRTRLGKSYEQLARDNFTKFDANGDLHLSEQEFVQLPGNVTQQVAIDRQQRRQAWTQGALLVAIISPICIAVGFAALKLRRRTALGKKASTAAPAADATTRKA